MNYAEFCRLWVKDFAKRPEARRMSPDVSWHAIRSYIKGMRSSCDDELAPEEFSALPRRRRSISEEVYRQIYDRVWCSWYKRLCDDENYWDDQDLAAHVLDAGVVQTFLFSVDLAQDPQQYQDGLNSGTLPNDLHQEFQKNDLKLSQNVIVEVKNAGRQWMISDDSRKTYLVRQEKDTLNIYAQTTDCAAIFCDEAQDFTPVELDIIFQLSLFGRRSLQPEELRRVPIVFAGDPLQTINPTGFRWDAVQSDFHERFCAVLDPRRRARIDLSYRELRFNYRSNPGIVGFCNLIQLVRAALLGARDIRPQETWWVDAPVQTVWFALDNSQTTQQLQQRPELVKLINCEEGEETEYVRGDSILKTIKEESEGIYRNILGPTRAKYRSTEKGIQ